MDGEKLVRMANQIGTFFVGQAKAKREEEFAVAGIADHIEKFWDPRMRRGIADYLASGSQTPLDPLVRRALDRIPVPAVVAPAAAADVPQPIEPPEEPDEPAEIDAPDPLDGFDLEESDEIETPEPAPEPIEEDSEDDDDPDLDPFDFEFNFDFVESELREVPRAEALAAPDFDEDLPEKVEPEIITPEIELDLAEWDMAPPEQIELQAIEVAAVPDGELDDEDFVLPEPEDEPQSKTAGQEPGR